MKTVKELLNHLDPEIKEKALKNAEDQQMLDCKVKYIAAAIDSFAWAHTPEGDQFWSPIYDKYAKIEDYHR